MTDNVNAYCFTYSDFPILKKHFDTSFCRQIIVDFPKNSKEKSKISRSFFLSPDLSSRTDLHSY